jgi:glycosyltransferase involved in cell wall biosynthesis
MHFPNYIKRSFSISVIEAMASGVPFVVSSIIGMGKTEKR